ncbi:excitatory amino acid transporter 5 isoform X2 [Syngnathus scovelli]|uniref:excitatory amino acid transporter 5 isoform X2 n=1 Tax=Syngnathus scovelli TaxID=161590 RepID=UPI0021101FD8|nr:excitatory amino acid transporter 5 isoform X2 [Syngnathus scovelli]
MMKGCEGKPLRTAEINGGRHCPRRACHACFTWRRASGTPERRGLQNRSVFQPTRETLAQRLQFPSYHPERQLGQRGMVAEPHQYDRRSCRAVACRFPATVMDELLLASGGEEEDACSERSSCAAGDGGGTAERLKSFLCAAASRDVRLTLRNFAKRNGLLTLSVAAVLTGCALGFVLRATQLSTQAKIYFSFPGELLMRMLKMLILPLITSRNMVPSNLIEATFQQYKTDLVPILKVPARTVTPNFVYVLPAAEGRTVMLELTPPPQVTYKTNPGSSQQMNVLGIVIFSATMGLLLGRMGERGAPLVNVCQCINECVMKIINAAVWYFPFGIIFLVAGKILDMQDPSTLGRKLGWYGITVLAGLFVHGLLLLPLFYFLLTGKNPFTFIRGLLQALVIALATSSSSATLPITMKCLLEKCHVDRQIARFVLPVGATINMDGTALYEAVAAIFIAQVNDYELDFGQLVTISITATAASIGAAGIPQAGLVTMVIVLTSVGLPPDDITLIVAIDWILDRFRTMINVLGDALAAGIIAHLCRKDFPLSGEGKTVPSYGTHECSNGAQHVDVPLTHVHTHGDSDAAFERHAHTVYYNICQV